MTIAAACTRAVVVLAVAAACRGNDPVSVAPVSGGALVSAAAAAQPVERPFNPVTNDWEPTVATDPLAPYVYLVTTRYGGTPACARDCPDPALILKVSSDGGVTFGAERYLCVCRGVAAQNDPQVAVARDGTVYAAWLNGFVPGVVFARSTDRGRTWTAPKPVMRDLDFSDKPILVVSPSGRDVYIAFNASDSYMVASHDGGDTFAAPVRTNRDERYYFANGGYVAPNGSITFAEASYTQTSTGPVYIHTMQSRDGGRSWHSTLVDIVAMQPGCSSDGCPPDYFGPSVALAGTGSSNLVLAYNGALDPQQPQRMFVKRSTDGGISWSARTDLSAAPRSANAAFPTAVGIDSGDVRIWYMDDRQGANAWNVWYRRSADGGRTWSAETRLSNASGGAPYKTPRGFSLPYGDYGGIAVTSDGFTVAIWGEGTSYIGPGGSWMARTSVATDAIVANRNSVPGESSVAGR